RHDTGSRIGFLPLLRRRGAEVPAPCRPPRTPPGAGRNGSPTTPTLTLGVGLVRLLARGAGRADDRAAARSAFPGRGTLGSTRSFPLPGRRGPHFTASAGQSCGADAGQ